MGLFAKFYVDGKEFTVLVSNHNMHQGTDGTGKPNARPAGGMYTLIFESTGSTLFFEWMVTEDMMKEAKLVFSPVTLNGKSRTIKLLDTHCIHYKEHFLSKTLQPMTTTVVLSPATIVENGEVMLQKHWFITDPNPVKVESKPEVVLTPKISKIIWIDKDTQNTTEEITYGNKIALTVKIANHKSGTASIKIEKEDGSEFENGEKSFTYVEAVDDDGLAEISEIDIKEKWEAFKTADVDKLIAKVEYKGAKKTSKPLKVTPPPKVLVDFRPKSNWNAEFGFDWLRMDDTSHFGDNKYEDIVSKQYTDSTHTTLERNQNKYKGSFKKDAKQFEKLKEKYGTFDISWKTKTDASGNKVQEKHVVQWLALKNGKTAELKLLLDIEEKADYLEFEDNEYFEFTPKKIDISGKGKGQNKKLSDPVSIKCKKEFTTDQEIIVKAYLKTDPKKGIIAGKIKAWANDTTKQKQKKVVFIEIKTPAISTPRKLKANAINEKSRINKYLNQAFIQLHPDSEIIDLDLSTDTDFVQFIKSQKITKKSITDATKKLITFLKSKLDSKYDTFFKAFYFAENGYHPNGNLSGYSAANADYVVVFKSANDQTAVHELLHAFNLTHTFANNEASANAEFTYEYKKTDNLLDYSHHPNNNNKRRSLWYWQWIKANNSI